MSILSKKETTRLMLTQLATITAITGTGGNDLDKEGYNVLKEHVLSMGTDLAPVDAANINYAVIGIRKLTESFTPRLGMTTLTNTQVTSISETFRLMDVEIQLSDDPDTMWANIIKSLTEYAKISTRSIEDTARRMLCLWKSIPSMSNGTVKLENGTTLTINSTSTTIVVDANGNVPKLIADVFSFIGAMLNLTASINMETFTLTPQTMKSLNEFGVNVHLKEHEYNGGALTKAFSESLINEVISDENYDTNVPFVSFLPIGPVATWNKNTQPLSKGGAIATLLSELSQRTRSEEM